MKNKSKIKQAIKIALIKAQECVFISPILYKLMEDLELLIDEGEDNDDTGKE